jgi:hypothetical protein
MRERIPVLQAEDRLVTATPEVALPCPALIADHSLPPAEVPNVLVSNTLAVGSKACVIARAWLSCVPLFSPQ